MSRNGPTPLPSCDDPTESSKLELELETVTADLEAAEEKWASLYEVVEAM